MQTIQTRDRAPFDAPFLCERLVVLLIGCDRMHCSAAHSQTATQVEAKFGQRNANREVETKGSGKERDVAAAQSWL